MPIGRHARACKWKKRKKRKARENGIHGIKIEQRKEENKHLKRARFRVDPPICPYCGEKSKCVRGSKVYTRREDWAKQYVWRCEPCDAQVGCHTTSRNERVPLGTLANRELRRLRKKVHRKFDVIWKNGMMGRRDAYRWLSRQLDIPYDQCHVAMFNEVMCRDAIEACDQFHKQQEEKT